MSRAIFGLPARLNKASKYLREKRFWTLFKALFEATVPRTLFCWDRQHIYECRKISLPEAIGASAEIRVCSLEDLPLLERVKPSAHGTRFSGEFAERIRRGESALLAIADAEPVGYLWVRSQRNILTNSGYLFQNNEPILWEHDVYIVPEHRREGISLRFFTMVEQLRSARGIRSVCCEIYSSNKRSLAVHDKLGFRLREEVCFVNILGFHIYRISGQNTSRRRYQVRYYPFYRRSVA